MKKRKTYHHGNLREALLLAAEKVLVRDGLAALSLRAIAREAGVSHGSPAHHFADLSGLLSDLAALGFRRLARMLRDSIGNPRTARADAARAYVRFALENPELYSLMSRGERLDAQRPDLAEARAENIALLSELNRAGTGESPRDALRRVGSMAATWALVHGFASLAIEGRLVRLLQMAPPGLGIMELLDLAIDATGPFGEAALEAPAEPAKRRAARPKRTVGVVERA